VLLDKNIHQVHSHVGCFLIQLKESTVVRLHKSFPDRECVLDLLLLLLAVSERLHHPECLCLHPDENLIQNFVSKEFNLVTLYVFLVQVLQLSLALVELVKVRILERNAGMGFVNIYRQLVLNLLDGQVLPDRSKLLVNVPVVSHLVLPLAFHQLQRLPQHLLWSHYIG